MDAIFAVRTKFSCDQFCLDLNEMVPVKNIEELRSYSGCFYEME